MVLHSLRSIIKKRNLSYNNFKVIIINQFHVDAMHDRYFMYKFILNAAYSMKFILKHTQQLCTHLYNNNYEFMLACMIIILW